MALVEYKLIQAVSVEELEERVNAAYDKVKDFEVSDPHHFIVGPPTLVYGMLVQWIVIQY